MGIMESLRNIGKDKRALKERLKEVAQERKIQHTLDEREKSSNERELESHMKEAREANIKSQLDEIRMRKTKEQWKGNNFAGRATILDEGRPILKERNLFTGNKNIFTNNKGMFFK